MNHTDKTGDRAAILSDNSSFETVLDETCDRLRDKKIQHSIRRIRLLEEVLGNLEDELEAMIRSVPDR
ncbi:MAG: hypothetical protein LBP93_08715 [Treponema sp.]|jgi:hypothetical protein|nr:hypothetical protein [Treponema sp.]